MTPKRAGRSTASGITYAETTRRYTQALVTAATGDEAETITRRALRDVETHPEPVQIVQGKNLGRLQEWSRPQPIEHTAVVVAMLHEEED